MSQIQSDFSNPCSASACLPPFHFKSSSVLLFSSLPNPIKIYSQEKTWESRKWLSNLGACPGGIFIVIGDKEIDSKAQVQPLGSETVFLFQSLFAQCCCEPGIALGTGETTVTEQIQSCFQGLDIVLVEAGRRRWGWSPSPVSWEHTPHWMTDSPLIQVSDQE